MFFQIKTSIDGFDEHLKGTVTEWQDEAEEFRFKNDSKYFESAGCYQHWPIGRAIFSNTDRSMIIWINEEDHMKFNSIQMDGNFGTVFGTTIFERYDFQNIVFFPRGNVSTFN